MKSRQDPKVSTWGRVCWDLRTRAHMESQQGPCRSQTGPDGNQTGSDRTRLGADRSQTARIEPRQSQMGPRCNLGSQVNSESAEPQQHREEPSSCTLSMPPQLPAQMELKGFSPQTLGPTPCQKMCSALTFNFQTIPNIHWEREAPLSLPIDALRRRGNTRLGSGTLLGLQASHVSTRPGLSR